MKRLFIVRHAKSSWDDASLDDFQRPLNKRGKRDAPAMGKRLADRVGRPDLMLSSPAVRAKKTVEAIADAVGYPLELVEWNEGIYEAASGDLIRILRKIDPSVEIAMVFGHNPTLTVVANELSGSSIANIPTCGVVELGLTVADWADLARGTATLVDFDYPKRGT
jgi:phosphohistidine phosphatase